MSKKDDLPIIAFPSKDTFESWLEQHGPASPGLWLKIAKKDSGLASITYGQALDVALCFGWIDGQKGSSDDRYWLQRFTPRKARSKWSKVNRQRATELIELGQMRSAGSGRGGARQSRWSMGGRLRATADDHRARGSPGSP